jgi:PHD/YefM family antitoxin component YafN of YafNO toxin-antitoxin module
MDADDWLKTIEKKLQVVQCNNHEKVLFASHKLEGPATDWWDAYVEAHKELESINWQEFRNNFRTHHVPFGMMNLKKKEFEDLKQGLMSVNEYVTQFTQLSRYSPDDIDIDEKKQVWFLNGLNDGLAYALEAHDFINFQDMVDKALVLENRRGIMERKRKMQRTRTQGSNSRVHIGSSLQGPNFCPGQQIGQSRMQAMGQGFQTPQHQIQHTRFQSPHSAPSPSQRNNVVQSTIARGTYFNCGQNGHFANRCPQKQPNSSAVQGVNQTPNLLSTKTHRRVLIGNMRVGRPRASICQPCSSHMP